MDTHVYPHFYPGPMTLEEYLRVEEASPERHEYVRGELYAMVGGTARHNWIAGRIYAALHRAAGSGPCRVFIGDVKLRVPDERIYYPDVMAICASVVGSVGSIATGATRTVRGATTW